MNNKHKLMIVTNYFPPLVGGSQVIFYNLLQDYQGEVMAVTAYAHGWNKDPEFQVSCETKYLNPPPFWPFTRYYTRLLRHIMPIIRIFISRQIKSWKPDIILAPYPSPEFLIPAYFSAKRAGIKFYVYMHDLWGENFHDEHYMAKLSNRYEKEILQGATRVFCITQAQANHYKDKFGIRPYILPHSIPSKTLASMPKKIVPPTLESRTVLFIGHFSNVLNIDSVRTLSRAAKLLPEDLKIVFCTMPSYEEMESRGVDTTRIERRWLPRQEVQKLQSQANLLVVPLSFNEQFKSEISTVFSTKLLEYLVSGRPILAIGPGYSFHTKSAREGNWAYVVDENDEKKIAEAIMNVIEDDQLAESLVSGALEEARKRNATIAAANLLEWMEEDLR
ncbi:glycosyltransferase family 4 protein [Calditrichota bacterium]